VQAVFDGPVGTDGVGDALCFGSQTADEQALFADGFTPDSALRFEQGEAVQLLPLLRFIEAFELNE
jgi:hypothetical protein